MCLLQPICYIDDNIINDKLNGDHLNSLAQAIKKIDFIVPEFNYYNMLLCYCNTPYNLL